VSPAANTAGSDYLAGVVVGVTMARLIV